MSDVNKIILQGRLVRNAEAKMTNAGLFVANFSIATNRAKKFDDGNWSSVAHYFNLAIYGKRAENLTKYLIKGQQVLVDGHLIQKRWESEGKHQSRIEIEVDELILLGSKNENTETRITEEQLSNNSPETADFSQEVF